MKIADGDITITELWKVIAIFMVWFMLLRGEPDLLQALTDILSSIAQHIRGG